MLPKLPGSSSGTPLGRVVTPSDVSRSARPLIVLPVPSLSVVVSASGMYWLTFSTSSAGTERLNGSFAGAGMKIVLNT